VICGLSATRYHFLALAAFSSSRALQRTELLRDLEHCPDAINAAYRRRTVEISHRVEDHTGVRRIRGKVGASGIS